MQAASSGSLKELLRTYSLKVKSQCGCTPSSMEEGALWVSDTKELVKSKVRQKVAEKYAKYHLVSRDPVGAFRRLALRLSQDQEARWPPSVPVRTACPPDAAHTTDSADREVSISETLGSDGVLRDAVVSAYLSLSRFFMTNLCHTTVHGHDHLAAALARAPSAPLITVSNHVAALDDPLLLGALLPKQECRDTAKIRWTMCASDRCFKSRLLSPLFRAGKVLKTERGAGLEQPAMWAAEQRLAAGEWVHVFPEGTRSRDGGRTLGRVRWGIGRLVVSCPEPPIVLPFVHSGMDKVMPRGSVLPRTNQDIEVSIGKPVYIKDLWEAWHSGQISNESCYAGVASRVQLALAQLKAEMEGTEVLMEAGVEPGLLGDREPSSRWWRRLLSAKLGSFAATATTKPVEEDIGNAWGSVLKQHAKLLGYETPPAIKEAEDSYWLLRNAEMSRIVISA